MKMSELIAAYGDDNLHFQNLDQAADSMDWSRKSGGKITFGTQQEMTLEGTKRLGLILWLDRDKVAAILKQAEG